jgi:hypothetical protein
VTGIQGLPPSPSDTMWKKAGDALTPDKSLDRIESKAGFVFQSLGLIGTVLAGLGVVSALTSPSVPTGWLTLLLVLLFLSIGLALLATLPTTRTHLNTENLIEVERFFTRRIRWRGWATRFALYIFAGAIVVAAIVSIASIYSLPSPSLSLQVSGNAGKATVTAAARMERLPANARATTVVMGISNNGATEISRDVSEVNLAGKIEVELSASDIDVSGFTSLTVRISIIGSDGRPIGSPKSLEVPLARSI